METSTPIISTQLGCTRSDSSTDVALLSPKKISSSPIMPDTCCCNLIPEQPFLGIEVRQITSVFNIIKQIGKGSTGTVSFATCCAHNKSFAIKQIEDLKCIDADSLDDESNDILTCLKTIDDTHIMKFHAEYLELIPNSVEENMRRRYLSFEYIEGFNVKKAFDQINAMTIDTIHYLMNQFFKITLALIKYNIFHSDLFFINILYCIRDKTLKVVDFGESRMATPFTRITAKDIRNIHPFYELGKTIAKQFCETLIEKAKEPRLDTEQLISWIKSESKKIQDFIEPPIPSQQEGSLLTKKQKELASMTLQQNKTLKRLSNETVIEILAWSSIMYRIFPWTDRPSDHLQQFTSHLKHFTLEKFLNLQKSLPLSNDDSFRELYAASLEIES